LNDGTVRYLEDFKEVRYKVSNSATFSIDTGPELDFFSDGPSLLNLSGVKTGLDVFPTGLTSIVKHSERAAMRAGVVAAVSYPFTSKDDVTNSGAILFYKWVNSTWKYDEVFYGTRNEEGLGFKKLEFVNDNILKIVSKGFEVQYMNHFIVSVIFQTINSLPTICIELMIHLSLPGRVPSGC